MKALKKELIYCLHEIRPSGSSSLPNKMLLEKADPDLLQKLPIKKLYQRVEKENEDKRSSNTFKIDKKYCPSRHKECQTGECPHSRPTPEKPFSFIHCPLLDDLIAKEQCNAHHLSEENPRFPPTCKECQYNPRPRERLEEAYRLDDPCIILGISPDCNEKDCRSLSSRFGFTFGREDAVQLKRTLSLYIEVKKFRVGEIPLSTFGKKLKRLDKWVDSGIKIIEGIPERMRVEIDEFFEIGPEATFPQMGMVGHLRGHLVDFRRLTMELLQTPFPTKKESTSLTETREIIVQNLASIYERITGEPASSSIGCRFFNFVRCCLDLMGDSIKDLTLRDYLQKVLHLRKLYILPFVN
jgi:hypothetical protein